MKVKGKYNYDYLAICLQSVVVKRFRKYAKKIASSQSEALAAMIDFSEWHGYTPDQRFGKDVNAGQKKNRKRIDAVIAIIKNVEKSQNIPLTNIEMMLKSLFEEEVKKYEPKLLERKSLNKSDSKIKIETEGVSLIEFNRTKDKLGETKARLRYILEQIEPVKNHFGKDYLRINIDRGQLARYKRALKN